MLEAPIRPRTSLARLRTDFGGVYAVNGLIGFLFAASGPVAVILSVGRAGGLSEAEIASWLFGAFSLNGLLTLLLCWLYRQPLAMMWTIPGAVLVGPALGHLRFAEAVGAFVVTGALMLALGLSGWVRRAMATVPMPIVMGMVAGVFLRFGIDLVKALHADAAVAVPMAAAWLLLNAWPAAGRRLPPMIGALLVGALAVAAVGRFAPELSAHALFARPILVAPEWSWQAMVFGALVLAFGLVSPLFTRLMLAAPAAFIATLAGLAMLRVLQSSFVTAFGGRFTLGALVTFLVTLADVPILNVGAAFWGLLAGFATSWLLERAAFKALRA